MFARELVCLRYLGKFDTRASTRVIIRSSHRLSTPSWLRQAAYTSDLRMSDANHTSILGEMPPTTPPPKRENGLFDETTTSCHPRSRVRIDFPPLPPVIMYIRAMPPPGQPGTCAGLSKPLQKPPESQEWARDASTREWKLVPTTTASPQRDDAPPEFALIFPPSPQQKLFQTFHSLPTPQHATIAHTPPLGQTSTTSHTRYSHVCHLANRFCLEPNDYEVLLVVAGLAHYTRFGFSMKPTAWSKFLGGGGDENVTINHGCIGGDCGGSGNSDGDGGGGGGIYGSVGCGGSGSGDGDGDGSGGRESNGSIGGGRRGDDSNERRRLR